MPAQRTDVRRKEIEGMMAIVAKGDATDRASVDKVRGTWQVGVDVGNGGAMGAGTQ